MGNGKIIKLQGYQSADNEAGYMSGKAICTACGHKWIQVVALPTDDLECPQCGTLRGYFVHPLQPTEGTPMWYCNSCHKGYLYYITPSGTFCARCGAKHVFD